MTIKQINKEIEEYGISQWYNARGLCSVYKEPDGYCLYVSTGNRLSNGDIIEERHGLCIADLIKCVHK